MSKFSINTNEVKNCANNISNAASKLSSLRDQLYEVGESISLGASQSVLIKQSIDSVCKKVNGDTAKVSALSNGVEQVSRVYETTEDNIIQNINRDNVRTAFGAGNGGGGFRGVGTSVAPISALFGANLWWSIVSYIGHRWGLYEEGWETISEGKKEKKFDAFLKNKGLRKEYNSYLKYDKKKKQWVYDKEKAEKEKDKENEGWEDLDPEIKYLGREYSKNASLIHRSGIKGSEDGSHVSGSVEALNFEASAGGYVSDKGAVGYIGFSASMLHLSAEAVAGNNNLGAYASGEVDVGKVDANAEVKIGLDKEGKFNASVGASAEALGGEASVKGGVKVLGTDVGVKASVNYGVGVKANVGIDGGVFKAELGATLGVGAGIKIEVDVSKTVDAVVGTARSALDNTGKTIKNVGNAAKSIIKKCIRIF